MKDSLPPVESSPHLTPPAFGAGVPGESKLPSAEAPWMPRPWRDELLGLVFLPRMLEKGRRVLAGMRHGRNLMNGYLFGNFDYADRGLLKFLRTRDARVLELLRGSDDDAAVAATLIQESGRSTAEIRAWSRRFRRINAPFTAMWDADEGRRAPGVGTTGLKLFYNYGLMPAVYVGFRIAQKLRPSAHDKNN